MQFGRNISDMKILKISVIVIGVICVGILGSIYLIRTDNTDQIKGIHQNQKFSRENGILKARLISNKGNAISDWYNVLGNVKEQFSDTCLYELAFNFEGKKYQLRILSNSAATIPLLGSFKLNLDSLGLIYTENTRGKFFNYLETDDAKTNRLIVFALLRFNQQRTELLKILRNYELATFSKTGFIRS